MEIDEFFSHVEETMLARFHQAGFIHHAGDKGESRECILRQFLIKHLPNKYGVAKGEIITKGGKHSHAADIIIYDAGCCPVLYAENTAILPIEGVYGLIEVKSRLLKKEFLDTVSKIESFKRLAPRDLSIIETREYVTVHRPSRPFGIVLGYQLYGNSLDSLSKNWEEENRRIHDVNFFANLVSVLGEGLLRYEKANLSRGEKEPLLDTDQFVNLVLTTKKRIVKKEPVDEIVVRIVQEKLAKRTFGRFFLYLLMMLSRMKLGVPDLGRYLDPDLPMMITRES